MNFKSGLVLVSLALIGGCYGSAPGRPPKIEIPELANAPDAVIVVRSETKTSIEDVSKSARTCPEGGGECIDTHYSVAEPVTRTTSRATLDHRELTFAQFKVITDPGWNERLARLDELSHSCSRANIPRYIGLTAVVTGLVFSAGKSTTSAVIGLSAIGVGIASYAAGYLALGGRKCNEAQEIYDAMDQTAAQSWTEIEGADTAEEMHELAVRFNAAHGGGGQARAETVEPPAASISPRRSAKPTKRGTRMHMR